MKPKSFKSKGMGENDLAYGVSPKQIYFQQLKPEHLTFSVNQFVIDKEQIKIQWSSLDAKYPDWDFEVFALDDIVVLAIGDSQEILTAKVADVRRMGGGDLGQVQLAEYRPLRSSKPLPSAAWEKFLKELKKKCGSGHDNKKKKTLLHVVRTARKIEARQKSIKLTVRQRVASIEEAIAVEEAIIEAATEGSHLPLVDIGDFFSEEPRVIEAKYVPQAATVDAMTYVFNGISFIRRLEGHKETINIPKKILDNAVKFPIGGDLLSLSDSKVNWTVTAYSHSQDLTTHHRIAIENISLSPNGLEYNLELYVSLEARARLRDNDGYSLLVIHGLSPLINDAGGGEQADDPIEDEKFENNYDKHDRPLLIAPKRYEFVEPDSNDDVPWLMRLQITYPSLDREPRDFEPELDRFVEGQPHLMSVGNIKTAVRVTNVTFDTEDRKVRIDLAYEGGSDFELLREDRGKGKQLIMKRALAASPAKNAAITLTLEKGQDFDVDADAAALLDDYVDGDLPEIADGIRGLLQDDPDGEVSLSEVADWIEENHQLRPDLMVTGVEHVAQRSEIETSISVTSGIVVDVWPSENGTYIYLDLDPEIENVQSLVNISRLVGDAPLSEVKENLLVMELDEIRGKAELREAELAVVPGGRRRVAHVSVHSAGEGGYGVCDNEEIYRVLRKKKDGKCIYRIVVKKGVRANQIAHGKHQTCVMYIDQQIVQPVD
jgi:hypothetical protein